MFDDALLSDYMRRFYGYGNSSGAFWFVGMEEGGGNSFTDVQKRITVWRDRGRKSLEDLYEFHQAIDITQWFAENARLQTTWSKLIHILLSIQGQLSQTEEIRRYQRTKLGRYRANHCIIELLPLPNPSIDPTKWWYHRYSKISYLATRETYQSELLARRAANLHMRIQEHQPKVVVFYGKSYKEWWKRIAGVTFTEGDPAFGTDGITLFVIMQHPAAHGTPNNYFGGIGETIRIRIDSSS